MPHLDLDVDDPVEAIQAILSQVDKDSKVNWMNLCNAAIRCLLSNQDQERSLNVSVKRVPAEKHVSIHASNYPDKNKIRLDKNTIGQLIVYSLHTIKNFLYRQILISGVLKSPII